ncbi:hypothetical protein L4D00_23715 [Photobacterium swingsii]|jgi:hypothetical protein|uniref:Elongation factor Ts n=1 Tax=Photobacterium chitinilyticum TaxID=2485123 RepID=A0A3S4THK6_9GAMM|nr:hypothetical protein [Photobacterium chitinilyticum]RWX52738.1 hypothetical protein EDI28_25710 [Photobacterium chitinilyticum]
MGTKELQSIIKVELNRIGWSIRKFSDEYFIEYNDVDNDDEMEQFFQKVKKQLGRSSFKNCELLDSYLDFIVQHPDYCKSRLKPTFAPSDVLSDKMRSRMYDISKELSEALEVTDL